VVDHARAGQSLFDRDAAVVNTMNLVDARGCEPEDVADRAL